MEQEELFGRKKPPRVHRRAIDATITAARASGALPAGDCVQVSLLRGLADRLDKLRREDDPKNAYAEAAIHREMREALILFGVAGADGGDAIDRLLAAMDDENTAAG